MNSESSDIFTMPPWIAMAGSITGPHPTLIPDEWTKPTNRPSTKRPSRPDTLRLVPTVEGRQLPEHLGAVRRGSPPPDLARVASSVALLGALLVALAMSWAVGG